MPITLNAGQELFLCLKFQTVSSLFGRNPVSSISKEAESETAQSQYVSSMVDTIRRLRIVAVLGPTNVSSEVSVADWQDLPGFLARSKYQDQGFNTTVHSFCEEDYIITHYIGEFFNTLTSFIYVGYGLLGIQRKRQQNVGVFSGVNFPYWALIGVGVCSAGYHMTLKYHTQMSDELSMHLAIGTVLHQLYTFEQPVGVQRRNTAIIVGILVPFVIYHCVTDEFLLHVILFLGMSILVSIKTQQNIKLRIADPAMRSKLSRLSRFGAGSALFGYFLWNIDVNLCAKLTEWKHQLGLPWGALLELHGYWHFFTAVGAYNCMAVIEFLTSLGHDDAAGVGFMWPARRVLRELGASESLKGPPANGVAGKAKKHE